MSQDKEEYEGLRWLQTAVEDLDAAKVLLEGEKFSHACFFGQQCGEKALKALWFSLGEDPWGHSIQKLIAEVPQESVRQKLENLVEDGAILDRYYVPTRYPNGLPDLTPGKCYFRADAQRCIEVAQRLLRQVEGCMGVK